MKASQTCSHEMDSNAAVVVVMDQKSGPMLQDLRMIVACLGKIYFLVVPLLVPLVHVVLYSTGSGIIIIPMVDFEEIIYFLPYV